MSYNLDSGAKIATNSVEITVPHISVLLEETINLLVQKPGGRYIDGTLGAGGHAEAILEKAGEEASLLGLDADAMAIELSKKRLSRFQPRVKLVNSNFSAIGSVAQGLGFAPVQGIVLDLGLSSMQLADDSRGFSFRSSGRLDMRFDPTHGQPAENLVNRASQDELGMILRQYGEEPHWRRICQAITQSRPLRTAHDLAGAVEKVTPKMALSDTLARVFQALRIAVNNELEVLPQALAQTLTLLAPGGRIAIISFHSLEDRLVKEFMKRESRDCLCPPEVPICCCGHKAQLRIITKKPVIPSAVEIGANPRSRSAKLRVAEALHG